jgi:hypothetical protein
LRSQNGRPARPDATVHTAWWWAVATRHAGCCATRQVGWLGSDWPMRSTALARLPRAWFVAHALHARPLHGGTAPPVLCRAGGRGGQSQPRQGASCRALVDARELVCDQRVLY